MAASISFLWLVLVGVVVSTLTIVLIFIMVNMCITKQIAKRRENSRQRHNNLSNEESRLFPAYADVEKPPPLPSRDQFLSESSSHSYEDVNAAVNPINIKVQTPAPPQPALVQHTEMNTQWEENKSVCESYDDIEELNNNACQSYEDVASLPDYLELDDDPPVFQEKPEPLNLQFNSQESLDSYDDVGEIHNISEDNASEDYDDVQ